MVLTQEIQESMEIQAPIELADCSVASHILKPAHIQEKCTIHNSAKWKALKVITSIDYNHDSCIETCSRYKSYAYQRYEWHFWNMLTKKCSDCFAMFVFNWVTVAFVACPTLSLWFNRMAAFWLWWFHAYVACLTRTNLTNSFDNFFDLSDIRPRLWAPLIHCPFQRSSIHFLFVM